MQATITIETEVECTVTGNWVAPDRSVGEARGYWEDVEVIPPAGLHVEHSDELHEEAVEALERAAVSEFETSQEP